MQVSLFGGNSIRLHRRHGQRGPRLVVGDTPADVVHMTRHCVAETKLALRR